MNNRSKGKPMFRVAASTVSLTLTVVVTAVPAANAQTARPSTFSCDQACLARVMTDFVSAMTRRKPDSVPLADSAEVRENTRVIALGRTAWQKVKAVKSMMTFADVVTGNVVSRAGVELRDGKAGYISTRLRIAAGGRITDVELSADTSTTVVGEYVWNLDPMFIAVLPADQRMSRIELEALARRYFHSLSTHAAVSTDFDERCNRFHSGLQITNVANRVEGGPPRTCAGSLEGTPPWGPATEQRFPVIEPERGIVFGVTLLHYPKLPRQPQMYVSEVFKVVAGRIVKIDNIGLTMEGVDTLGFVH